MPSFGSRSRRELDTTHPDIVKVMELVITFIDFSVTEGVRTDERQMQLFKEGRSKLDGVNKKSYHQV